MNRRILILVLAVAAVLLAVNEGFNSSEAHERPSVRIETDPDPFPDGLRGVPFDFQVTVLQGDDEEEVHLSLVAVCPSGGIATLSGDATGNACEGPIETLSKDLDSGSVSWAFTVVYQGSTGTYQWTIEAHGDDDEKDDDEKDDDEKDDDEKDDDEKDDDDD